MNIEDILRATLIVGGLIFTTLSFVIIFTGKKVGDETSSKNVISFRGLEFKANNILMLIFISMLFCIMPLVIPHLIEKPTDLTISGIVQDKQGQYLRNASIILYERIPGGEEREIDRTKTKSQGDFNFLIKNIEKEKEFYLEVTYQGKNETEYILPIHGKKITIDTSSEWSDN